MSNAYQEDGEMSAMAEAFRRVASPEPVDLAEIKATVAALEARVERLERDNGVMSNYIEMLRLARNQVFPQPYVPYIPYPLPPYSPAPLSPPWQPCTAPQWFVQPAIQQCPATPIQPYASICNINASGGFSCQ